MYTIAINFSNKTEYVVMNSLWASRLMAERYATMNGVESVDIVNNETGEVE